MKNQVQSTMLSKLHSEDVSCEITLQSPTSVKPIKFCLSNTYNMPLWHGVALYMLIENTIYAFLFGLAILAFV